MAYDTMNQFFSRGDHGETMGHARVLISLHRFFDVVFHGDIVNEPTKF